MRSQAVDCAIESGASWKRPSLAQSSIARTSRKRAWPKNGSSETGLCFLVVVDVSEMPSTSEGSRALGRMRAFMGVELRLSGAGEIGISFLGCACVCACGGGGAVVGCFR